jgi:hypothetical protein
MFSLELVAAVEKEAAALGITGATAISTALREQLVDRKGRGGTGDHREREYYVAARVVEHGMATPLPGVVKIVGLNGLSMAATNAAGYVLGYGDKAPHGDCAKGYIGPARVGLSRNGQAHVVVQLPHSRKPPAAPDCWVDLWIFRTPAEADSHFRSLTAGKVF